MVIIVETSLTLGRIGLCFFEYTISVSVQLEKAQTPT